MKRGSARRYSPTTLKKLFGFSGNQCAHPDCLEPIIAAETAYSEAKVIGQIAHIYARGGKGPRSKLDLPDLERDGYPNLLLLCPTHHAIVDGQHESFPAGLLVDWKSRHERKWQVGPMARDSILIDATASGRILPSMRMRTEDKTSVALSTAGRIGVQRLKWEFRIHAEGGYGGAFELAF